MIIPGNTAVRYLDAFNHITRKIVGADQHQTEFIYIHHDGTVTLNDLNDYTNADVTSTFDLYPDGSLKAYRYNNTLEGTNEYVYIQYAQATPGQQQAFGSSGEFANGPVTSSISLKDGILETKTFVNGKPVLVEIENLNPETDVFHLKGTVDAAGIATISLTNVLHPAGLINTAAGSLTGMLNLNTSQLISDNGIGLVSDNGLGLVGQDGGTLISDAGWTFNATNSASLISDNGIGLIGQDGGSLITDYGAGLVGQDGGTLQAAQAAHNFNLNAMSMMFGHKSYKGPATFTEPPDDHGETAGSAGTIDVGQTIEGTLETDGDTDWYAIELEAGREYTFSMSGADSGVAFLEDPRLSLVDANGNPVLVEITPVADDDSGIGRDARITFTPTESGTYHVVASNFGHVNRGTYELSVEVSPTAAFVKSAAPMILDDASPIAGAPVMAYISAGEYAGGFVLAWIAFAEGQHPGHPSDGHLQVQIVTAQGLIVDLDVREEYTTYSPDHAGTYNDADDADPSIAVFADGSFVVTYTDSSYNYEANNAPKTRTTWVSIDANGDPAADGTMIPTEGPGEVRYGSTNADVVVLENGDWLTVLHRDGVDGVTPNTATNIQVSLNGANPDPTESLGGTDFFNVAGEMQYRAIAASKFGSGAVAVWTDVLGDNGSSSAPGGDPYSSFGVKGAVLSASGNVLATFDVNQQTDFGQVIWNGSQVADLGGGRFVVAWTSFDGGRRTDSFFRIFSYDDEEGGVVPVTNDIPLGDNLFVNNASIVALPSGGFAVVYSHDGTIYMRAYTESGAPSGNQTIVASGGASGTSAVVIEDGRIVVAFNQNGVLKLQHMEPNVAPTDITLNNSHINENSAATTLIGTLGAVDGNSITDSFTYEIVGGDGTFYIANGNELRFDSPFDSPIKSLDHETTPSYDIDVKVTDSAGISVTKTLTITVDNVNERPTGLTSNEDRVDEDLAVGGTAVTLQGIDPDSGTTFSYSLRDENGNALTGMPFEIVGNAIKLTAALDFETRTGYTFYVRVSDGTLATSSYNASGGDVRFTLSVDDVDDRAPHGINLYNNYTESIDEDETVGTIVGAFLANDTDTSDRDDIEYEILNSDGTFRLERTVDGYANLILDKALDHETDDSVDVTIRATDPGGRSFDKTFTFAVDDINEAPIITNGGTRKDITFAVGTSINTILYAIDASDPDGDDLTYDTNPAGYLFFDVDANGNLRFSSAPTAAGVHDFKIFARDEVGHQTYQDVRVTVTSSGPTNQAPVIIGDASIIKQVNENTTQVAMIEATDAEFQALTWSLGGPDAGKFKIVAVSNSYVGIEFKTAPDYETPTDIGTNNTYNLYVVATDSQGAFDVQSIAVQVQNVTETPPRITSNGSGTTATISLKENLSAVTTVTATGTAPITYSITGTDAADFIISSSTGALSFRNRPDFEKPADANKDNTYLVTVKASNGSLTDTQALTVKVLNDDGAAKNGSTAGDKLNGTTKEEMLNGKEGNDTIKALAGGDTIIGGKGADDLYGGPSDGAADTFKFLKGESGTTASTWDQLYDFVSGIDKIDLSGIDGDPKTGRQPVRLVTKFEAPGSKTDGQFRIVDTGANVNVEIDLNGDKKADMIIQVMNVASLAAGDFVL